MSTTSFKKKREPQQKSILVRKSRLFQPYTVTDSEGVVRTPKPLDPHIYEGTKERQITSTTAVDDVNSSLHISSVDVHAIKLTTRIQDAKTQDYMSIKPISDMSLWTTSTFPEEAQDVEESCERIVKTPTHISLILRETDTFFLLDMPSCTEYKDTPEGLQVAEDNDNYDYLTEGKGRNRRTISVAVQTVPILMKTRTSDCVRVKMQNTGSYASNWEMYDTLLDLDKETVEIIEEDRDMLPKRLEEKRSADSFKMSAEERQIINIIKNPRFQHALCVIERLLANNYYHKQQKIFRDIWMEETTFTDDEVQYRYDLEPLWVFGQTGINKSPVITMQWNPANNDLLAVAHGKFFTTDWTVPMVNIWNVKNPVNPERSYTFSVAVTDICFSFKNPNLLGISFYNGQIWIINVSRSDLDVIARTEILEKNLISMCNSILFFKSIQGGEDEFIASYNNGKVMLFRTLGTELLKHQQIMCIPKADSKLKGLETIRVCRQSRIPAQRYVGARVVCQHPEDPTIYYIGTNDGVVHICSRNYLNQHLDMFLAHEGPILALNFHPSCHSIFVTCGSDMYTRVWAEGVWEPLAQFCATLSSTIDFQYSPIIPTMAVSIKSNLISIWDMQRKTFKPQSSYELKPKTNCTCFCTTDNGKCLVVGDSIGQVHVFAFKDIPYPPFFPENVMVTVFKSMLYHKPALMGKVVIGLRKTAIKDRMKSVKIQAPQPINEEDIKCKAINIDLDCDDNDKNDDK